MNKLDDIVTDLSATAYCLGQDYKKGDGSMNKVDVAADKAKQQIKEFMLELINESTPQGKYHVNTEWLQEKVKEL